MTVVAKIKTYIGMGKDFLKDLYIKTRPLIHAIKIKFRSRKHNKSSLNL